MMSSIDLGKGMLQQMRCHAIPFLFHLAHDNYPGLVSTKQRLRELYGGRKWKSWYIQLLHNLSLVSHLTKLPERIPTPLQPVELPQGPFQKVAVDIMGPFEKGRYDCRFAICLVDYFGKWPEVALAANVTATTVTHVSEILQL